MRKGARGAAAPQEAGISVAIHQVVPSGAVTPPRRSPSPLSAAASTSVAPADSARAIGLTYRRDWRPTKTQQQFLSYLREVSAGMNSGGGSVAPAYAEIQ